MIYKGALQGQGAHTVWIGNVLIRKVAEGIETYEENRNLVLTDGCQADSVPNLEIETGEIEGAGHASATGRFDDEQLFYLRSRGIAEDEARRLVVHGFFNDLIRKIDVPELEEQLVATVEAELAKNVLEGARSDGASSAPASLDEFREDEALGVTVGDQEVAVARDGDEIFAVEDICSHAAVALSEGEVEDCTVECWLHGSRFDLRTGKPTGLPATEPVATFPVEVRGDRGVRRHHHHPERSHTRNEHPRDQGPPRLGRHRGRGQGDPQGRHADHQRRRDPRDHGPQRLGQVDAGLLDRRPPEVHRHLRHGDPRRRRTCWR